MRLVFAVVLLLLSGCSLCVAGPFGVSVSSVELREAENGLRSALNSSLAVNGAGVEELRNWLRDDNNDDDQHRCSSDEDCTYREKKSYCSEHGWCHDYCYSKNDCARDEKCCSDNKCRKRRRS